MALKVLSNLFPGVFRLVNIPGGVTQKVVMLQSHFKCICNLRFCTSSPKSSTAFSKSTNLWLISSFV